MQTYEFSQFITNKHYEKTQDKYQEFASALIPLQTPDTLSILFATDVHYIRRFVWYMPAYYKIKEMAEFSECMGIDLFALAGDIVDGNEPLENQYSDIYDIMKLVKSSKATAAAISKGNHDDCSWYAFQKKLKNAWIDETQWYNHVVNPIRVQYPIQVDPENPAGGYYSIDYPLQKIRVINLNSNDVPTITNADGIIEKNGDCGQWCFGMREKQLKWLKKVLTFTESGWSVLFISHIPPISDPSHPQLKEKGGIFHNENAAWELIRAFKNNEKGHIISIDKNYEADFDYDFTQNASNDVLPYLFGHYHNDIVYEKDGITFVSSKNILSTCGGSDEYTEHFDTGWDCILIDKKARTFKSKRFGIPEKDREFNF